MWQLFGDTTRLQIEGGSGDEGARIAWRTYFYRRFRHIADKMFGEEFSRQPRGTKADNVLQDDLMRLVRALDGIAPVSSAQFWNLSAILILRLEKVEETWQWFDNDLLKRLGDLTRKMLRNYPGIQLSEQSDDVIQMVCVRLIAALKTDSIHSQEHLLNVAKKHIEWVLNDLSRKRPVLPPLPPDEPDERWSIEEMESLDEWRLFHDQVKMLPQEVREVFDLIWYKGQDQEQAAKILGVSVRTVRRRIGYAKQFLAHSLLANATEGRCRNRRGAPSPQQGFIHRDVEPGNIMLDGLILLALPGQVMRATSEEAALSHESGAP